MADARSRRRRKPECADSVAVTVKRREGVLVSCRHMPMKVQAEERVFECSWKNVKAGNGCKARSVVLCRGDKVGYLALS